MDAEYVVNSPTPVLALTALCAPVKILAQVGDQLPTQFAHGLSLDAVVHGFV